MRPGLYLHIPFCQTKCPYCDFYSITNKSLMPSWLEALEQEINLCQNAAELSRFDSVYLGGGTPSLLSAKELTGIVTPIQQHFMLTATAEITLEANPDDVTPEKLRLWKEFGVNRLSLGVQSIKRSGARFLGRRHDAAQARHALILAREAGFDNLGVDLMYALPRQTEAGWQATLEGVLAWQPEHLSCYQLTIEANTPLGEKRAQGQLKPVAEEQQRAFFLLTSEFLEARGYLHYEISNFARGKHNISRHNTKYWQHVPYLGLGPAAHSFDGRVDAGITGPWSEYCRVLAEGRAPIAGEELFTERSSTWKRCASGCGPGRGWPWQT